MDIIEQVVKPYDATRMKLTIANVVSDINDASNTTVCWAHNHNGGVNSYNAGDSYTLPEGVVEAGDSVIVAEVEYNYTPLVFDTYFQDGTKLTETFYLKPRLSSYVEFNGVKC